MPLSVISSGVFPGEENSASDETCSENYSDALSDDLIFASPSLKIKFDRNVITLETLSQQYGRVSSPDRPLREIINKKLEKVYREFSLCQFARGLIPIVDWLPKYSIKNDLIADLIAGFTISILHIPQGIAYSLLAGLPAVHGLYVSFFPVLIYALMGTSKHISIGSFAVASIMLSNTAEKLEAIQDYELTGKNSTMLESWPPTQLEVLTAMGLTTGVIQVIMGFLRLGALSLILSDHFVSGFSTGVAVHVATSQVNEVAKELLENKFKSDFRLIMFWALPSPIKAMGQES